MQSFLHKIFGPKKQTPAAVPEQLVKPVPVEEPVVENIFVPVAAPEPAPAPEPLPPYQLPAAELFGEENKELIEGLRVNSEGAMLPVIWSVKEGKVIIKDLADIKCLLAVGALSSGKTVFLQQLLLSLLATREPAALKLILVDAKGVEFVPYGLLEGFFLAGTRGRDEALVKDAGHAQRTLDAVCFEIDRRFALFALAGARNIGEYSEMGEGPELLPFIVLVIDDLTAYTYGGSPEILGPLNKLICDGYKVGLYVIISTSPPSKKSLPDSLLGMIQQRVAFHLNNSVEYKRYFEAAKFTRPHQPGEFVYRGTGSVLEGNTVEFTLESMYAVAQSINSQRGHARAYRLPENWFDTVDKDPLLEEAARLVVQNQMGSTSLIQRRMKLGYNRAGRIMEQLELAGIVGPNLGVKARDVLVKTEYELQRIISTWY